ncbi:DUF2177 family protein [Pseudorhodoferax sp. Leaf274]|uniref:DUF2177 family protein n=1 Tax=Pseudorhodoferax sp. Leaf274 TaxID=1736318 RepID=UPI000702B08E|nr:DUF2177 family protein [Pseudorhodoferax sp. Leaf274]KQP35282.1 hypothetical protein ASF44_18175 [Pseudorhodoferax sp. Leaf274]
MPLSLAAIAYAVSALVFLGLDAIWLGSMAERLYRPGIGHLMAERFAAAPAVLFYVLYVGGIVFFAIAPTLESRRPVLAALGHGALLGLLAYATFDLTNQAVLKDWPWHVTLADLAWGSFVTAMAAAGGAAAAPWLHAAVFKN